MHTLCKTRTEHKRQAVGPLHGSGAKICTFRGLKAPSTLSTAHLTSFTHIAHWWALYTACTHSRLSTETHCTQQNTRLYNLHAQQIAKLVHDTNYAYGLQCTLHIAHSTRCTTLKLHAQYQARNTACTRQTVFTKLIAQTLHTGNTLHSLCMTCIVHMV